MTVTLFLDVDGVLSPVRGPSHAWSDWEEVPFNDYFLVLSREMAARLAALPVKIVRVTTWRQLANSQIGSWFGWPPCEVIEPRDCDDPMRWKARAIRAHVQAGGGPFVWVDDDLRELASEVADVVGNHPHLLLCPDPTVGLTAADAEEIERFLLTLED